jgi:hypothetical protein
MSPPEKERTTDSAGTRSANARACAGIGRSLWPLWFRRRPVAQSGIRQSLSNLPGFIVSSFGHIAIAEGSGSVQRSNSGIYIGSIGECCSLGAGSGSLLSRGLGLSGRSGSLESQGVDI